MMKLQLLMSFGERLDMTNTLEHLPTLAAAYIREHGWTQGVDQDEHGQVCLTGALRLCTPIPGDGYIAREVFRKRRRAESWNDMAGRTANEVIDYLESAEIVDAELAEVFGPQWREIVVQVRQISGATVDQIDALDAARGIALRAVRRAAMGAASWDSARANALDAAMGVAHQASPVNAVDAAVDAAAALSTRDLIGTSGYTREHYELLIAPWVSVFGTP